MPASADGTGRDMQSAIVVHGETAEAGTAAMQASVEQRFGRPCTIGKRAPLTCAGRRYELVDVRPPLGPRVSLWFDVTAVPRGEGPPKRPSGTYAVKLY